MFNVTIELPESIKVALGDTGKETLVDVKAIAQHPVLLRNALLAGFIGSLNNISRGKDDNDKPNSDAVWETMRRKRVDAWMQGDWSQRGGAERPMTALKEAFIDERRSATGATIAQVERSIKDTVAQVFGKDETASFGRFLDAVALMMARRDMGEEPKGGSAEWQDGLASYRERLEAKYQGLADAAKEARAKAGAKLDLSSIEI